MPFSSVCTLLDQRIGRVRFFARIKPCVDPNDFELDIRVGFLGEEVSGVDAAHNFGDRERSDVADRVGFGHFARDMTDDCAPLVKAGRIGRNVVRTFVACCVLKLHIREFLGDVDGRVHIAKGGREDHLVTRKRHLGHHALSISPFRHTFNEGCFYLIAIGFNDRLAAFVMLVGPAEITDRADIDEAYLVRIVSGCRACKGKGGCRCCGEGFHEFHFYPKSPYWIG